jgi:tetratricopeptide (TPR) repeat protein
MDTLFRRRYRFPQLLALLLLCLCVPTARPQTTGIDGEDDPVKLFERGQDAHAKNDYKTAIEFYEAAIKLKPEFPEAEFQRAMALLFTNRKEEALQGFNRAVALRPDWALAYSKFGTWLGSYGNDGANAEPILRRAIELNKADENALVVLAQVRQHAGDLVEALSLIRSATSLPAATSSTWRRRSFMEIAIGDRVAALASVDKALALDPRDVGARYDRAKLRLDMNDREGAYEDLKIYEGAGGGPHLPTNFDLAQLYDRAGKREDALRVLDVLSEKDRQMPEVIALREEIAGGDGSSAEGRAALEQMLERDPKNATLLARLGTAYRRINPVKSQDYFYRALQVEPNNTSYAVGYAGALVQGRLFAEAVKILRAVIAKNPNDYVAHTNLALALHELKDFPAAIVEFEWIEAERPQVAATYFFLATAHDNLQQYEQALIAYEKFLARADPAANKLEIEKTNLRLPVLREQIKRGQGAKRKRP